MKNTTIILAHPYEKSFNKEIFNQLVEQAKQNNENVTAINLYEEKFEAAISTEELSLYREGKTSDKNIERYLEVLRNTNKLVLVFPIWWYDMPSMMKGFLDKVFLRHTVFTINPDGSLKGHLTNIENSIIVTTSQAPTEYLTDIAGCNMKPLMTTLTTVGSQAAEWHNLEAVETCSNDERNAFIAKAKQIISK